MSKKRPQKGIACFKDWFKEHKLFSILAPPLVTFGVIFIFFFAFLAGHLATIEIEMVKALVQAEATIIGFFGAIYVFALTSLDKRMDERQNQIINLQINKSEHYTTIRSLSKQIEKIKEEKNKIIWSVILIGIVLFSSLICSILAIGLQKAELQLWAVEANRFSIMFLIMGFANILWTIYFLKFNPEDS